MPIYKSHSRLCVTEHFSPAFAIAISVSERLKFTPTPQAYQCLELNKEGHLQCSAKGRQTPTIRWIRTGLAEKTDYYCELLRVKDVKNVEYGFTLECIKCKP